MKLIFSIIFTLIFSSVNAGLEEAIDALEDGDFKTAIFNIKKEIEKNDKDAKDGKTFKPLLHQMLARTYYRAPDDVDSDYKLTFEHYQKSLDSFDSGVQYRLGFMHYMGRGVEQNTLKAVEHLENSIKYEERLNSLWLLGKIYLSGDKQLSKDYDKALEYFERGDEVDSANSQFELGHMHEYGKGVPISIPRAIYYYEKAAKQGDADAQYKLDLHTGKLVKSERDIDFEDALDYTYGFTYDVDIDKAIELYKKSADKGNSTAIYNIGFVIGMYATIKKNEEENEYYKKAADMGNVYAQTVLSANYSLGIGIKIDKAKAHYWDVQAALNGKLESIKSVATNYYLGEGTNKNFDEAIKWFQKAVDMGDDDSVFDLANMYRDGEGFEQDEDKAIEMYTKAADMGNVYAQNRLAKYYFKGTYVNRDYQKSYDYALKAAEQGNANAQNKMGNFYLIGKGVVEVDMKKAIDYFEKAAEQGNAKAHNNLGALYLSGKGVKKDKNKAFALYKKAADFGDAESQYKVGTFYDYGLGNIQKDVKEAIKWYTKAYDKDHKNAQIALGQVYYYGDEDANIQKNYKKAAAFFYKAAKNKKDDSEKDKIDFKPSSYGSGFFVTPNHIITNNHVTEECDEIKVKNKHYESKVKLVDTDANTDLSILETGKPNDKYLYLRSRKPVRTGEQSIALGYPFASTLGSELKVTSGNIAALTGFDNNIAELQLTSPVQPGNSGGPLLDDNGNVIGIIVSRLETSSEITGDREAQNVNFAIKSNMAKIFMDLNEVDYSVRKTNGAKSVSEIVDESRDATVQIICKEKE